MSECSNLTKKERAKRLVKHSAPKGTHDILPPDTNLWQIAESIAKETFEKYGFNEIRMPVIEHTEVFIRSIGENTDIVEKEMYTFSDKAGRSITLRPEGTASAVRCYIEHNLYNLPTPQKFFYTGPMFRYERPQKGRFRQFHQIGVEAFGEAQPSLDAEIIAMLSNFLNKIKLVGINFELNSIGCENCRPGYKTALTSFFERKREGLCPDCQRRHISNPLRILDCKVTRCIELRQGSPMIPDYLCNECTNHFNELRERLESLGIAFIVNPELVRGLDYYTKTTFEVTSSHLGSQKAVAAGGRYDRLVQEFGGPPTPAIGFAIGMERLITLLKDRYNIYMSVPDVYMATIGRVAEIEGIKIAENLREKGYRIEMHYGGASLRSQLRKADRIGAPLALIIGDDELKSGWIKWKDLNKKEQGEIEIHNVSSLLETIRGNDSK
jgi:histidyl-tRNA synthetase